MRTQDVLNNAKVLAQFVHDLGLQTETQELDLTTAEFGEYWKIAKRILALLEDHP